MFSGDKMTAVRQESVFSCRTASSIRPLWDKEDSFLVTGNIKHSPKKPFIATPAEMLTIIYEMTAGPGSVPFPVNHLFF